MKAGTLPGQATTKNWLGIHLGGAYDVAVLETLPIPSPRRWRELIVVREEIGLTAKSSKNLEGIQGLLEQAEHLADIGSWELNFDKQTITWSEQFYRMLGREPKKGPIPLGHGMEMIHPDDRERAIHDIEVLRKHGIPFDHVLRFVTATGSVRIFHSRAMPITDEAGRVVLIRGMSRDITIGKAGVERLREREALLVHAEQIANFGSWEFDFITRKVTVSDQLRRIYGITPDFGWTEEEYWERCHPMDRPRVREIADKGLAERKPFEYVSRYLSPEGGVRIHLLRAMSISGEDGKVARVIGVLQDVTDQKLAEDDNHRLSQQLMSTRDEERRNIARELHESAGQSLAALKMTVGQLRKTLSGKNKRAHALLHSLTEQAEDAIREVRTISYLMHPPLLDEAGLGPALRWYARGFAERSGINVSIDVPDDFARQSRETETTVFRIVQEALTNVHRYSGSRTAQITLTRDNGRVRAEVRDNGCGLAVPRREPNRQKAFGVGIAGMRERVQQLNGEFEIESAPGRGTTVRAILPDSAHISEGRNDGPRRTNPRGSGRDAKAFLRHLRG
jgi:PAS domain S-box-containing protein